MKKIKIIIFMFLFTVVSMNCNQPSNDEKRNNKMEREEITKNESQEIEPNPNIEENRDESEVGPSNPNNVIEITMNEWEINAPSSLPPGTYTFIITNTGAEDHNLEITGNGAALKLKSDLKQNEINTIKEVSLSPGTYKIHCPKDDHAVKGMSKTLTIN